MGGADEYADCRRNRDSNPSFYAQDPCRSYSVSKDLVLGGKLPSGFNLAFHIVLAAGCILGIALRRYRYHQILGVAFAAVIAVYIGLLFTRLQ